MTARSVTEFMRPLMKRAYLGKLWGTPQSTVIELAVPPATSQLRRARHWVRDELVGDARVDRSHVEAVQTVASELLTAALEAGIGRPLVLSVELFPRLTSVRVRCPGDVDLRDEPFGLRENVLQGLAFAWGKRTYANGSVDLWAEIARPARVYENAD
jgi:hypothetical protein